MKTRQFSLIYFSVGACAVLLISMRSCWGSNVDDENASSATTAQVNDWVSDCQKAGYDPWQLNCQTCRVLPHTHRDACRECCISYKDVKFIKEPYKAAVLVTPVDESKWSTELANLIKEDWDTMMTAKGGSDRLYKIPQERANMVLDDIYTLMGAPAAEVLFFDRPLTASDREIGHSKLLPKSKEAISLQGYKREDIRDMIMSLVV